MSFDIKTAKFQPGFEPKNARLIDTRSSRGQEVVLLAYTNEFKGKGYVQTRELYCNNDGEWCPTGKGWSWPLERALVVFGSIAEFSKIFAPATVKSSARKSA